METENEPKTLLALVAADANKMILRGEVPAGKVRVEINLWNLTKEEREVLATLWDAENGMINNATIDQNAKIIRFGNTPLVVAGNTEKDVIDALGKLITDRETHIAESAENLKKFKVELLKNECAPEIRTGSARIPETQYVSKFFTYPFVVVPSTYGIVGKDTKVVKEETQRINSLNSAEYRKNEADALASLKPAYDEYVAKEKEKKDAAEAEEKRRRDYLIDWARSNNKDMVEAYEEGLMDLDGILKEWRKSIRSEFLVTYKKRDSVGRIERLEWSQVKTVREVKADWIKRGWEIDFNGMLEDCSGERYDDAPGERFLRFVARLKNGLEVPFEVVLG